MHHRIIHINTFIVVIITLVLLLTGCKATATPIATSQPTLALEQTSGTVYEVNDFTSVHTADGSDPNKFLIFGNLPIEEAPADLPEEIAVFLGRWEGYDYAPPVVKDRKLVLAVTEIDQQGGKAYGWSGTNLQFPDVLQDIHFRVNTEGAPIIEWQYTFADGNPMHVVFTYDKDHDQLIGGIADMSGTQADGPYVLTREKTFMVYQDYEKYLGSKNITTHTWQDDSMTHFGQGYMLYLPDGYTADESKNWPLLFFLHGYGDRGGNLQILAKASPFMYIREQGPLPFIIAAPLLTAEGSTYTFPEVYLDGALEEIRTSYRVDDTRIYLTGLSMGGEGAWKFALHQPDTFAAMAVLSAYHSPSTPEMMTVLKDLPVWAIHGANDTVVPLAKGQEPADALKAAGGNIQFTVLPDHDHDTWTDTYSDPAFYDWLLQYQKQ